MRKARFTEHQIIAVIKSVDARSDGYAYPQASKER